MEHGEVSHRAAEELTNRELIERLQLAVAAGEQVEPETTHRFTGNLYSRECTQPAGCIVIGAVHKQEHFFVLLEGEMTIWNDGERQHIVAPAVLVSPIGTKRALYAHKDCRYMTLHQVSSRDLEAVERELVEDDPLSMYEVGNKVRKPALEHT